MNRGAKPAPARRDQPGARELIALRRRVLTWFDRFRRDLPWRRTSDPYAIWLSEVMLQQTRVESVIPYYERFLADFPTVRALADASLDDVLRRWAGLGYYSRARNLHRAAQTLAARNGDWPRDAASWRELPGVGRYVAAAVASIAFDRPNAALDGNIKRVLARWMLVDQPISLRSVEDELWTLAELFLDQKRPGDWNQALMELGATLCAPRAPRCEACPARGFCRAAAAGRQADLPKRGERRTPPRVEAVAALIERSDALLMVRRPPGGLLGGLWELPGGELDESLDQFDDAEQRRRERITTILNDRFQIKARPGRLLGESEHVFTHRRLRTFIYQVTTTTRRIPASPRRDDLRWCTPNELADLPLATADRKKLATAGICLPAVAPSSHRQGFRADTSRLVT